MIRSGEASCRLRETNTIMSNGGRSGRKQCISRYRHDNRIFSWSRTMHWLSTRALVLIVTVIILASIQIGGVSAESPIVTTNWFKHLPSKLSFFGDQSVVLYFDSEDKIVYRSERVGREWQPIKDVPAGKVESMHVHPFDDQLAFLLTSGKQHYVTRDRGATWSTFDTPLPPSRTTKQLAFHAERNCTNTKECRQSVAPVKSILCIETVAESTSTKHNQLVRSDNLFTSREVIRLDTRSGSHAIQSVIALGVTQGFIVAAGNDNTHTWARAHLPSGIGIKNNEYTILESSAHSEMHDQSNMKYGTLLSSNSNGTFYTVSLPYTSRSAVTGKVDYERVTGVEGIALHKDSSNPPIKTKITFDDGGSWRAVKPPLTDEHGEPYGCGDEIPLDRCSLHLHSVTETRNIGRVFSASVGSVGNYLEPYEKSDTFASKDGGITWQLVHRGPYKWEMGDAGNLWIITADQGDQGTDTVLWSDDHGEHWHTLSLGRKLVVHALTTTRKSNEREFLLIATLAGPINESARAKGQYSVVHLDFTPVQSRKCHFEEKENDDFELWQVRSMLPSAQCLMGQKTWFWRKKQTVTCYVGGRLDVPAKKESCPCQEHDYECDYNYIRNGKRECVLNGKERIPPGQCIEAGAKFTGSSGYRLITGNSCDREQGVKLDEPTEKPCPEDRVTKPPEGKITYTETIFNSLLGDIISFKNSTTMLLKTLDGHLWRSSDEAASWKKIKLTGSVVYAATHPLIHYAYVITDQDKVYITKDRGSNFDLITTPLPPNKLNLPWFEFHTTKPSSFLFTGSTECPGCHTEVHVTHDDGKTWHLVKSWAQSCVSQDKLAGKSTDDNILVLQLMTESDRSWRQLLNRVNDMYLYDAFVLATTVIQGNELNIYTSSDGIKFTPAQFPPNLSVNGPAFTLLTSGSGALFIDIVSRRTPDKSYGTLFSSNYNGTKFSVSLANTNRDNNGLVDIERLAAVQGVLLANTVTNTEQLVDATTKKQSVTRISYNDGRTWHSLKPPAQDVDGHTYNCTSNCHLHLHGQSTAGGNTGELFSSPSTPGLLMGVGNVGEHLQDVEHAHTYLSRDAGQTWQEVRKGASFYEFGNYGALIVMVDQQSPTNELWYSWDMGDHWTKYKFSKHSVKVTMLTTRPGSTSTKFIIVGLLVDSNDSDASGDLNQIVIQVDFSQLEPRQCEYNGEDESKNDFEIWDPLSVVDASCFLGQKTLYWRRKMDHICLIDDTDAHALPQPKQETCTCQIDDYDCDNGFWRDDDGKCSLLGLDPRRPSHCEQDATYKSSAGYVKNPRSKCSGGDTSFEGVVDRKCSESRGAHADITRLSHLVQDQFYFPKSENIMIYLLNGQVWRSANEGKEWHRIKEDNDVTFMAMYHDAYFVDRAIFVVKDKDIHYMTNNQGDSLIEITTPLPPSVFNVPIFQFHPTESEWMIYMASQYCNEEKEKDKEKQGDCHAQAFSTKDGGKTWHLLARYVHQCQWLATPKLQAYEKDAIICEVYKQASGSQRTFVDNPLQMIISHDEFKQNTTTISPIVGYSIQDAFLVVAATEPGDSGLLLHISMNGKEFALAEFPSGENILHKAYTLLEPTRQTLTLHITESAKEGVEWGNLLNSNWNGTYYTQILDHVNRNSKGLVDFERILGIEGVAMANQTRITYDNGQTWQFLPVPKTKVNGFPLTCKTTPCHLHLHGFTERTDSFNVFSAPTAIGLMMGVGNVGSHLEEYANADTYLTRDAGRTWQVIRKGPHLYAFGDHGGLIVLVSDVEPVDYVLYSTNEGRSFEKFYFTNANKNRRFLLFGTARRGATEQLVIRLDFRNLFQRKCILDMHNESPDQNDFECNEEEEADDDDSVKIDKHCLFGHETKFIRRIPDRDCFIGRKFTGVTQHVRNCTCTAADLNGNCVLAPGIAERTHGECDASGYMRLASGYRRIGLSTCQGGMELDVGELVDCQGNLYIYA
ncbi:hypothetical protein BDF22DRAFT_695641 [Syncephalis plumigaleata]|nr:hypothetical protein BDF22DRAFT_695641 [Syncephalis plumigaleata]